MYPTPEILLPPDGYREAIRIVAPVYRQAGRVERSGMSISPVLDETVISFSENIMFNKNNFCDMCRVKHKQGSFLFCFP
jgi:hypothetical protein